MRAFVAIELPSTLQADLNALQQTLAGAFDDARLGRALRWTPAANLHLTLRFLGETSAAQHALVLDGMRDEAARTAHFALMLGGLGCFPSCRRPSILWAGVQDESGRMAALQQAIEEASVAAGFAPEVRGFAPHLTLARIARATPPGDVARIGQAVERSARSHQVQAWRRSVQVAHIAFMQSDLQRQGPVYTALDRVALG